MKLLVASSRKHYNPSPRNCRRASMLTNLYVANFKSIGDKGIDLHPKTLTVLTGPNGAGKSSVLEALCLLSQTIGYPSPRIDAGEYVRYSSPQSFLHNGDLSRPFQISLTLDESRTQGSGYSPGFFYGYRYSPNEVTQRILFGGEEVVTLTMGTSNPAYTVKDKSVEQALPSVDARILMHLNTFDPSYRNYPPSSNDVELFKVAQKTQSEITSFLTEKFFFISAFRGASKFFLEAQSGIDPRWVGTDGSATNHILAKIFGSRLYNEEAERIALWADKFSLGGLKAGWAGGGRLKSDYVDPVLKTVLDTPLASHGSRQALTFLTQVFWSKPGTTLVIEEPEISLHPESQTLLPMLFAEATRRGVQIVITTRSPFVVLSLWKPVAEKMISAQEIAVYHIDKGEDGSLVKSLQVGPDGNLKEWVPSFSAIEARMLKELMEKVPTH